MYAGLFAPDGKFLQRGGVSHTGREALANVGYRNSRGPQSVFHYLMSHAIEPTPDGNARGKEQLVQWDIGDDGEPSRVFGGGHYDDIYERTQGRLAVQAAAVHPLAVRLRAGDAHDTACPSSTRSRRRRSKRNTMTASDYIEIQQLLARYPYGLDTGQRKGQMWVDLFTPDATFNQSKGREALMKIAWQHRPGQGPAYNRNFPQSVVITPTPEGAIGRTLDLRHRHRRGAAKPSTLLNGATYQDVVRADARRLADQEAGR